MVKNKEKIIIKRVMMKNYKCPICDRVVKINEGNKRGNHFEDFEIFYYYKIRCYNCMLQIKRGFDPTDDKKKREVKKKIINDWKSLKNRKARW